jgi:hypothetical protein
MPTPTKTSSDALHHPPVAPATPPPPFDEATLDAPYEAALDRARAIPEGAHEGLVAAWVARRNAAAVAAVAHDDRAPGVLRKAARRAINVLKSRGVAIPDRPAVTASLVAKPEFTVEARMMFPDGRGAQLWWIAKVAKTGGADVVEVTTVDRVGIVGCERGRPTAGNLKQLWGSWVSRAGRAPVAVPVAWARQRIAAAKALSTEKGTVLPMGIDGARELLEPDAQAAAQPIAHPIDGEDLAIPTADEAVKARIERSMHLHEEPEFASWLPDDQAGVALLQAINERVQAVGLVPGQQPSEELQATIDTTVNETIDQAADAYFDDARKQSYVARLRDAAWSLYQVGLVDRAIDAIIVGHAIEKAGVISDRPSEIPFVRGMFMKLIAIAQQRAAAMAPNGTEEASRLA